MYYDRYGFQTPEMRLHKRAVAGAKAFQSGLRAEAQVAAHYAAQGAEILARRWRGQWGGEVDLILRLGDCIVFVEVKSSSSFHHAVQRLTRRQLDRIGVSATEYFDSHVAEPSLDMRIDVALVDANGTIEVIENAFWQD